MRWVENSYDTIEAAPVLGRAGPSGVMKIKMSAVSGVQLIDSRPYALVPV
jgi:hypothetical protein